MTAKLCRVLIIVMALIMTAGCDDVGPGSGGNGEEAGVAEGTSGSFTMACLRIDYTAEEDGVTAFLHLNNRLFLFNALTPQNPRWTFESPKGDYTVKGSMTYYPKSATQSPRLTTEGITIGCDGQMFFFAGTIATWQ